MRYHWLETADRVSTGDHRILGEDCDGALFVPARGRPGCWDARFTWRNPLHWRYWLRSRLTSRIAFLDTKTG